ncbi:MAG: Hsp20/alpha crystallin family protein [Planctomycetota bacterium]|nr:Hsp20/alpha crystallin family protein [Planctomycetota bacterium]
MFPRTTRQPSLFSEMDRIYNEVENLVGKRSTAREFPPVAVWANGEGAVVIVEIPGIVPGEVDLSVAGNLLTLRGERKSRDKTLGAQSRLERTSGAFSRTLELPFQIEAGKVAARSENGLLAISLPRAEADKPHRIAIQG